MNDLDLRWVEAGKRYPPPEAKLKSMRWLGAGWPDYTWLFGTDGEYTAYAAVAAGQFAPIKAHLRALRDVSVRINGRSGKIVHEVTPDGAVYFGANEDPGNTDESSKYPSAVALVWRWTGDERVPPRPLPGLQAGDEVRRRRWTRTRTAGRRVWGTSSGPGWARRSWTTRSTPSAATPTWPTWPGREGDDQTRRWAVRKARALLEKFEETWWYGGDTRLVRGLAGRTGQREDLPAALDRPDPDRRGAAPDPRAGGRSAGLGRTRPRHPDQHERDCYTGDVRPVPHRHRPDIRAGRQPGRQLRLGGLRRCPASGASSP